MTDLQSDLDNLVRVFEGSIDKQTWKVDRKHVTKAISALHACSDQPEYQWLLGQLGDLQSIYDDKYHNKGQKEYKLSIAFAVGNVLDRHKVRVSGTEGDEFEKYLADVFIRLKVTGDTRQYVLDAIKNRKMTALLTPEQIDPY